MSPNHPFPTIKQSLQYYPSIHPNVFRVLEHIFLTNGNGYQVDKSGDLVCNPPQKNGPCITEEGLYWMAFDMIKCDLFTVYPINSYEYEKKNCSGLEINRFYTDFYAYPAMSSEWQRAARWFLWQLTSRSADWWKRHYRALDANPAVESYGGYYKQYYGNMMKARKYLSAFAREKKIKIDASEAIKWECELLMFLRPDSVT